jgi:hypothetical protein
VKNLSKIARKQKWGTKKSVILDNGDVSFFRFLKGKILKGIFDFFDIFG